MVEVSLETFALLLSIVNGVVDEVKEKATKFFLSNITEEKKYAYVIDTYGDNDGMHSSLLLSSYDHHSGVTSEISVLFRSPSSEEVGVFTFKRF